MTEKAPLINSTTKAGLKYQEIKTNIQPFDLILFKGHDFVSKFIQWLSRTELGDGAQEYSHAGIIVTRDILDIPELLHGKLYIFESTMSGNLADGVPNIDGTSFLGVQIRDFDEVMKHYDGHPNTRIHWLSLKGNPIHSLDKQIIYSKMQKLYEHYKWHRYEINPIQLFAAMFPRCRWLRPTCCMDKFVFCSELVADVYNEFGVFSCHSENVIPADFAVQDEDKEIDFQKFDNYLITYVQS